MKKVLLCFICLFTFANIYATNFFSSRFFEIKVEVPAFVSNNAFKITDILKESPVIDLPTLATQIPLSGFDLNLNAYPNVTIQFKPQTGPVIGAAVGVDLYGNFNISQSLFTFLGFGNTLNQDINVTLATNFDIFSYVSLIGGYNSPKLSVIFSPSVVIPVAYISTGYAGVTVRNTESGEFIVNADATANLFTSFVTTDTMLALIQQNPLVLLNDAIDSAGVDLSAKFRYSILSFLDLTAKFRVPIIPCRLDYLTQAHASFNISLNLLDILTSGTAPTPSYSYELRNGTPWSYQFSRPLKVFVQADLLPKNDFLSAFAGVGFGIKHPFSGDSSEIKWYPEYLLGAKFGIYSILMGTLSSEYTDQIFIHQLMITLNLRFVQVDAGVSLSASSFVDSFNIKGVGVYAAATIGF